MKDLVELVRTYSDKIENGRRPIDVYHYLFDEVQELKDEVYGTNKGPDGIRGEAIDVIVCALDLIYKVSPEWTNDDIVAYAEKKCEKWAKKYG